MFTRFFDLSSGGNNKEKWDIIIIKAPKAKACKIFEKRFGHSPYDIACFCCGENYSVSEYETLEEATPSHSHKPCLVIHKLGVEEEVINKKYWR
jgi:hypothetical protein